MTHECEQGSPQLQYLYYLYRANAAGGLFRSEFHIVEGEGSRVYGARSQGHCPDIAAGFGELVSAPSGALRGG